MTPHKMHRTLHMNRHLTCPLPTHLMQLHIDVQTLLMVLARLAAVRRKKTPDCSTHYVLVKPGLQETSINQSVRHLTADCTLYLYHAAVRVVPIDIFSGL